MSSRDDLDRLAELGDPVAGRFSVPPVMTTELATSGLRGLVAGPLAHAGIAVGQGRKARQEALTREQLRLRLITALDGVDVEGVCASFSSIKGGVGKTRMAAGFLTTAAAFRSRCYAVGLDANPDMGTLLQAVGASPNEVSEQTIMTFLEAVENGELDGIAKLLRQVKTPGSRDLLGRPTNVNIIPSAPGAIRDDEMAMGKMVKIIQAAGVFANLIVGDSGTGLRSSFNYGLMAASNAWVLVASPSRLGFEMALRAVQTYDGTGESQPPSQHVAPYKRLAGGVILVLNKFDKTNLSHQYWLKWANLVFPGRVVAMPYDETIDDERPVVLRTLAPDTMDAYLLLALAVYESAAAFEAGRVYTPAPSQISIDEALAAIRTIRQTIVAGPQHAADQPAVATAVMAEADIDAAIHEQLVAAAHPEVPRRDRRSSPRRRGGWWRRFDPGVDVASAQEEAPAEPAADPASLSPAAVLGQVREALDDEPGAVYSDHGASPGQADAREETASAVLPGTAPYTAHEGAELGNGHSPAADGNDGSGDQSGPDGSGWFASGQLPST